MRRSLFTLAVVLTLLVLTVPTAYARPNEWTTICHHVVQPGETIYCIARAYGVAPWAITAHNGIVHPNLIHPGRWLAIPDAYTSVPAGRTCARQCPPWSGYPCTCASYHTIVHGENLYRISRRYGVSMWRLAECNNIYNLNYIRAGDVLCIP
jgi:spore germination protein